MPIAGEGFCFMCLKAKLLTQTQSGNNLTISVDIFVLDVFQQRRTITNHF